MIPFVNLANPLPTTPGTGLTAGQEAALATATRRQPVASIAALKALAPSAGDAVTVLGYYSAGDGGGGTFYYDGASAAADNGGTIIAPTAGGGRWLRAYSGAVNVRWFGAKGDGATDDAVGIQAAITAAAVNGDTVWFPRVATGYLVEAPITVTHNNVTLKMESPLIYAGAAGETCLTIGGPTSRIDPAHHTLMVSRATVSNWTSETDVGIELYNHYNSKIHIARANRFTIGVRCLGYGRGFVYNTLVLGEIYDNKVGLDLSNGTVASNIGWCNENLFLGGRFGCATDRNPNIDRIGIRITSDDGTYIGNNGNIFEKPSIELTPAGTSTTIPFLVVHGEQNYVHKARIECADSSNLIAIRTQNASKNNYLDVGYNGDGDLVIDDKGSVPTSVVRDRNAYIRFTDRTVRIFEALHRKACFYDGSSEVSVQGLSVGTSSSTPDDGMRSNNLTIHANYLAISSGRQIGVFMSTNVVKRFMVLVDCDVGYGGRINIRCYDSSGNVLTSSGENAPYVLSTGSGGYDYGTAYGGSYRSKVDTTVPRFLVLHADVSKIFLGIGGGTSECRIRGFSILTPDIGAVSLWTANPTDDPVNWGITPPTAGTWAVGRRVYNPSPSTSEGWICTAAGTPGTWKVFGTIAP